MYVSLNGTLTAGRVGWPEFAELAARAGYPGTDVNVAAAVKLGAESTRELLSRLKLRPAVVALPVEFRKDQATFDNELPNLEPACQLARVIGCPRMTTWILPSSELPKKEQAEIYRRRFRTCMEVISRHGIKLGLEFVSPVHLRKRFAHEFIWRMDEMLEFAHSCAPGVGLLLDSWHWHHAGGTAKDIETAGRDAIIHVQVADSPDLPPDKIVDSERLMPGEGVANLNGFFRALQKIGYSDGVSPEVFGRGLKDMKPEEGAQLGLRTTLVAMKKAGVIA